MINVNGTPKDGKADQQSVAGHGFHLAIDQTTGIEGLQGGMIGGGIDALGQGLWETKRHHAAFGTRLGLVF